MNVGLRKNKSLIAGSLAAFGASLCCITPVIAGLASVSGIASTFAWIEPYRPYLIGLTVLLFATAWFQQLKGTKEIDCNCKEEKKSFWQSKTFLSILTLIAVLLIAFPYYIKEIYPASRQDNIVVLKSSNVREVEFKIQGMSCDGCIIEVNNEISKVNGVINYHTTLQPQSSIVKFDATKTTVDSILNAINKTGYTVVSYNEMKN